MTPGSDRRVDYRLRASGPSGSEATKLSDGRPRRCLTLCVVRVRAGAPGLMRSSMFPDMQVLDVEIDDQQRLVLTIESGRLEAACPAGGVLAVGHGRRVRVLHDAPCFGRVAVLRWLVRIWRCREQACPTQSFSVTNELAPPRTVLTTR